MDERESGLRSGILETLRNLALAQEGLFDPPWSDINDIVIKDCARLQSLSGH